MLLLPVVQGNFRIIHLGDGDGDDGDDGDGDGIETRLPFKIFSTLLREPIRGQLFFSYVYFFK